MKFNPAQKLYETSCAARTQNFESNGVPLPYFGTFPATRLNQSGSFGRRLLAFTPSRSNVIQ
ncbi:hypothetical protein D3C81_2260080 [compost metagenome]